MIYIENEGALFRGPARGVPLEVWSGREGKFVPYKLAGQPKPIEWGNVISEAEAQAMMGAERKGIPGPEERPDLYDFADVPEDRNLSSQYVERTMPEHIKKRIAERTAKDPDAPSIDPAPDQRPT